MTFYFKDRNDAVNTFLESFHLLRKTIKTSDNNVEKWVKEWDKKIELICKKIGSFSIYKNFGNSLIDYELISVTTKDFNNGFYFLEDYPFYLDENIEDYNWETLEQLPDMEV